MNRATRLRKTRRWLSDVKNGAMLGGDESWPVLAVSSGDLISIIPEDNGDGDDKRMGCDLL